MRRRDFIAALASGAAVSGVWPLAVCAQQAGVPVIGSLFGVSAEEWTEKMAGFRRGLGEGGFVEGRNIVIEYRWANGQFDRMFDLAAQLIARKVDAILVGGNTPAVRTILNLAQTIPIVFRQPLIQSSLASSPASIARAAMRQVLPSSMMIFSPNASSFFAK